MKELLLPAGAPRARVLMLVKDTELHLARLSRDRRHGVSARILIPPRKKFSAERAGGSSGPGNPATLCRCFVVVMQPAHAGSTIDVIDESFHTHPVSKRLQILLPEDEYRALADAAQRQGKPVARVVRESLRRALAEDTEFEPEERIAAVLRFARFAGPTGDIDQLLNEIERGRGLA